MNRSFKVIWNKAKQLWVTVGELAKSKGKSKSQTALASTKQASVAVLIAAISLGVTGTPVLADEWNVSSGNWATDGNWADSSAPTSSDDVHINNGGTATITGSVASNTAYIGRTSSDSGVVSVDGGIWTSSADLYIGRMGGGTLTISNGGTVSNTNGYIGYYGADCSYLCSGSVTVDNSTWTNSNTLYVGKEGIGYLTIQNGSSVANVNAKIGENANGAGEVTVNGGSWVTSGELYIGQYGNGILTISNSGTVESEYTYLGYGSGSSGTVTVDGGTLTSNSSYTFNIGQSGSGSLTIANSGVVNAYYSSALTQVVIAYFAGSEGTLNIGAAYGESAVAAGTLNASSIKFRDGSGSIVFNHTDSDYEFSLDIEGSGSIGLHSGTTSFSGDLSSSYTGTVTVDGGTLSIAEADTLTLGGDYTQTSGTLQIGASSISSFGKLAVTGTATFAADSNIDVDVAGVNILAVGETLSAVVTAGSLTATTFDPTDNSALFNFEATVNGNQIDLNVVAAPAGGGNNSTESRIIDSVNNEGLIAGMEAAYVLSDFITGGTTGTDMDNVVTALGNLETDEQVAAAVAESLPLLVTGTTQVTSNNMHNTTRVIQARQSSFNGLSSGDGFITDKHLWVKPVGSWTKQQERNGVSGYDADSYGFVGGIDGDINDGTKLGFAVSYMSTDVEGNGSASGNHVDIDAYQAIFYGSYDVSQDIELNWQADMGINKNEGTRHISFMNRTAKADYDSYTAHIGVGAAKSFTFSDKTTIVPSVRADYAYIKDESYNETGADALNLNVGRNSSDELILMAQGNVSHQVTEQTSLTATAGLGYDVLNDSNSLTASYSGGGTAFTTKGIDPSPWLARAGAGINYQVNDATEITAHYDLEGREDFLNQTVSVKARWMF